MTRGDCIALCLLWLAAGGARAEQALPSAQPGRYVVGIAPPAAQVEHADQLAGPLQQYIEHALRGVATFPVILRSGTPAEAQAEAKVQGCDYFVMTQIQQKHSGGSAGGFFRKIAPLAGALPGLGALGGGGSGTGAVLGQAAASVAQTVAQQQAMGQINQMGASPSSGIKAGDSMTVEYRLVSAADGRVVHADHLESKAKNDGEDLVGPMLTQVAANVVGTLIGVPVATAGTTDGGSGAQAPAGGAEPKRGGFLGGMFGGHQDPAPAPSQNVMPQNVDCDAISRMPGATMSPEFCRQMSGAQGAYQAALNDPRAARPGDDSMTCAQIAAEIQQQQYTQPDQQKVAEAQKSGADLQHKLAAQQAEITAIAAKQQAEGAAAMAADAAVEHATLGVVNPRAALAVEMRQQQENRVTGERMARERAPQERQMYDSAGDLAKDATSQIASNPRLAKLIQMANSKQCKF